MAQPKARSTSTTSTTPVANGNEIYLPHDRVAKLAFEKWCQRGRPQGTDQQDWLAAEAELRAQAQER